MIAAFINRRIIMDIIASPPILESRSENGTLHIRLSGSWLLRDGGAEDAAERLKAQFTGAKRAAFDLSGVTAWDTSLVALLFGLMKTAKHKNIDVAWHAAPGGVERLLKLAFTQSGNLSPQPETGQSFLERVGKSTLAMQEATGRVLGFIGEMTLAFMRLLRHKAYFRRVDFLEALADAGPRALPIVTLISFLVGLILAFVGSMQLQQFGAQIFIANLVGVAMTREMGAMMTGIIMAGRTGASYAARIGTMQVNEEVDALRTNGMNPLDFLALPRILALVLMVPVLCVYADAMGILGGMSIGVGMLDLSPTEYWNQTVKATRLVDCWAGLIKSVVFALVVGFAGCYHGLRCGRSSEAVGRVTTTAVVSAIVFIIITDSLLTVVYNALDF